MGALTAALASVAPTTTRCKFGQLLDQNADQEDRDAAESANVVARDIWEFATENWGPVSYTCVKDHRARRCTCYARAVAA